MSIVIEDVGVPPFDIETIMTSAISMKNIDLAVLYAYTTALSKKVAEMVDDPNFSVTYYRVMDNFMTYSDEMALLFCKYVDMHLDKD